MQSYRFIIKTIRSKFPDCEIYSNISYYKHSFKTIHTYYFECNDFAGSFSAFIILLMHLSNTVKKVNACIINKSSYLNKIRIQFITE